MDAAVRIFTWEDEWCRSARSEGVSLWLVVDGCTMQGAVKSEPARLRGTRSVTRINDELENSVTGAPSPPPPRPSLHPTALPSS
jgi:hypothetical protein